MMKGILKYLNKALTRHELDVRERITVHNPHLGSDFFSGQAVPLFPKRISGIDLNHPIARRLRGESVTTTAETLEYPLDLGLVPNPGLFSQRITGKSFNLSELILKTPNEPCFWIPVELCPQFSETLQHIINGLYTINPDLCQRKAVLDLTQSPIELGVFQRGFSTPHTDCGIASIVSDEETTWYYPGLTDAIRDRLSQEQLMQLDSTWPRWRPKCYQINFFDDKIYHNGPRPTATDLLGKINPWRTFLRLLQPHE